MTVIKSFFISFSIYSKIPVPQFLWKEEDMKYTLCFFPWVGAVIGALAVLWGWFCRTYGVGEVAYAAIGSAIPLLVSGGFHVDGFMDTMDAFHSYQEREKKLEILKDSHIGAFAVICLLLYYLIYVGAYAQIYTKQQILMLGAGYFLSRTLSGIGVVSFRCAKKDGMLYLFASEAHRKIVKLSLYVQLTFCVGFLLYLSVGTGILVSCGAVATFWYYKRRCDKELGGITGDTAGYFVTLCEGVMAVIIAISQLLV